MAKKYKWVAESNDKVYYETSREFDSRVDAYNDMRDAVLQKMEWNTDYEEDFENDNEYLEYKVIFSRNEIIHKSYSGKYTYRIIEIN